MITRRLVSLDLPPEKWFWHLDTDGLTQSAIQLFMTCREQFRLRFMQGWVPRKRSFPLEVGTCFHFILQNIRNGLTIAEAVEKYTQIRHDELETETITPSDRESLELAIGLSEVLANHYQKFWPDNNVDWVVKEEVFDFFYRGFRLRGRWDGIIKRPDGSMWLFETKTMNNPNEGLIRDTIPGDFQILFYMLAIREMLNKVPSGVVYDVIQRPSITPGIRRNIQQGLAKVNTAITKQPSKYFFRLEHLVVAADIERFEERVLYPILTEIRYWYKGLLSQRDGNPWKFPGHWLNPVALVSKYGRCDLFGLITKSSTFGLKREHPFTELREEN